MVSSTSSPSTPGSMLQRVQGLARHFTTTTASASTAAATMSSTKQAPTPRWKTLCQENIAKAFKEGEKSSVLYQVLSTVSPGPPPVPHSRYVVHRGFVNEQRSKETASGIETYDKNYLGSNSLILTTTDIRAPKAQEMAAAAKETGQARGEICWWQESSQMQLRLNGYYHLLPTASHPLAKEFPGERLSPPHANSSSSSSTFDWAQERTRIYEKLSPDLLASFARPIPGTDHPNQQNLTDGPGEEGDEKNEDKSPWPLKLPAPGKEENDEQRKHLKESEKNFALLVFEPLTVDVVDLSRDKRSLFERQGDSPNGEWKETRLVP